MATPLTQLVKLISAAAVDLESAFKASNVAVPSLNQFTNTDNDLRADKVLTEDPKAAKAASTIIGAAGMLINMCQSPIDNARWAALGFTTSSCVNLVTEANIPELLREKGEVGMSTKEIASIIAADEKRLARVLRFLATHHIFQEVAPDVFANNRNSLALDSGVPFKDISKPEDKIAATGQSAAFCNLFSDIMMKMSVHLPDVVLKKDTVHLDSPFNHWAGTDLPYFAWLQQPENKLNLMKFHFAMGSQNRGHQGPAGFDWKTLPDTAVIVDVGGGQGYAMQPIAESHAGFKIIVQDVPEVIAQGQEHWSKINPRALESQAVTLQAYDFFTTQPVKGADMYFLRTVLHDWADAECIKILTKIREAASANSKLLVLDGLVDYACPPQHVPDLSIPGSEPDVAPEPLLANYGVGGLYPYRIDMIMMHHFPSQERTLAQMKHLFDVSGWKLVQVFRSEISQYVGIPN